MRTSRPDGGGEGLDLQPEIVLANVGLLRAACPLTRNAIARIIRQKARLALEVIRHELNRSVQVGRVLEAPPRSKRAMMTNRFVATPFSGLALTEDDEELSLVFADDHARPHLGLAVRVVGSG